MSTRVTVYQDGKKAEGKYSLSDASAASRDLGPGWISSQPSKEELDSVARQFGRRVGKEEKPKRKGVIREYQGRRLT